MKALIFAAGLGARMRPLTERTPKPLLVAGGEPLIVWHLRRLAALGVTDVVINTSWLAEQFPQVLGDGSRYGTQLHYAYEGPQPLETGGGMLHALPLLGEAPFIAINGDIWSDFALMRLPSEPRGDAHLVLIDNPAHHPAGDFRLCADYCVRDRQGDQPSLTFAGIGVYRPALLDHWDIEIGIDASTEMSPPRFKLAPLLRAAMRRERITGEHHRGLWTDVGTPARLAQLDAQLAARHEPREV